MLQEDKELDPSSLLAKTLGRAKIHPQACPTRKPMLLDLLLLASAHFLGISELPNQNTSLRSAALLSPAPGDLLGWAFFSNGVFSFGFGFVLSPPVWASGY